MRVGRILLAVAVLVLGSTACRTQIAGPPGTTPPPGDPLAVLRTWDDARSRAFAEGDAGALRALYLPGSRAGRRDVRLLRRYADRGLRVVGLQTQVLEAGVRVNRPGDRLVVELTDRVVGATAVGSDAPQPLPRSQPRTRVVTLVARGGAWVVGSVRLGAGE